MTLHKAALNPQIILQGPQGLTTLCESVTIRTIKIKNDGLRGVINAYWEVSLFINNIADILARDKAQLEEKTRITNYIKDNYKNSISVNFPPMSLHEFTTYKFSLSY